MTGPRIVIATSIIVAALVVISIITGVIFFFPIAASKVSMTGQAKSTTSESSSPSQGKIDNSGAIVNLCNDTIAGKPVSGNPESSGGCP
jgi:hypothetical protein